MDNFVVKIVDKLMLIFFELFVRFLILFFRAETNFKIPFSVVREITFWSPCEKLHREIFERVSKKYFLGPESILALEAVVSLRTLTARRLRTSNSLVNCHIDYF